MTITQWLTDIKQTDWAQADTFMGSKPDDIIAMFATLASLDITTEDKADIYCCNYDGSEYSGKAYNQILFTVGNNHAGTYYPEITQLLPWFFNLFACADNQYLKNTVLQVLIEIYYFTPDVASQLGMEQISATVRQLIDDFINNNPEFQQLWLKEHEE